jgi:poly-gamma-glutamate synthesis protein (capsule biosynthesis protein)
MKINLKNILVICVLAVIASGTGLTLVNWKAPDSYTPISYPVSSPNFNGADFVLSRAGEIILDKKIRLLMFGDMMAENPLADVIINDQANPFDYLKSIFKEYDLKIGNLETTINGRNIDTPKEKPYTLSSPTQFVDRMKDAGLNLVTMANNHAMDYGDEAFFFGYNKLLESGIIPFGAGKDQEEAFEPRVVEVKGTKFAFIGINSAEYIHNIAGPNKAGTGSFIDWLVRASIEKARTMADIVIIWPHWGDEHTPAANDFQIEWGHKFIDYGADLVVGSHPHVRQNVEEYKGKFIYYSLGNFVFTGMGWNPEAVQGYMLHVEVEDKKIIKTWTTTVDLNYHGYPVPRE